MYGQGIVMSCLSVKSDTDAFLWCIWFKGFIVD